MSNTAIDSQQVSVNNLPNSESCKVLPIVDAQVRPGFVTNTYFLMVSGEKPLASISVKIIPRIYVVKPEWWAVEIVGCLEDGITSQMTGHYSESKEIWFWGKQGIDVIGQNKTVRFDLKGNVVKIPEASVR